MKRKLKILMFIMLTIPILAEIGLRLFGLGEWIIYEENQFYEYRMSPNLSINRFYRTITSNSYGMRASNEPEQKTKKVLKFGDSVLNGGSKIDDKDMVNTILQNQLTENGCDI